MKAYEAAARSVDIVDEFVYVCEDQLGSPIRVLVQGLYKWFAFRVAM